VEVKERSKELMEEGKRLATLDPNIQTHALNRKEDKRGLYENELLAMTEQFLSRKALKGGSNVVRLA
jgi:hypothetical protein